MTSVQIVRDCVYQTRDDGHRDGILTEQTEAGKIWLAAEIERLQAALNALTGGAS